MKKISIIVPVYNVEKYLSKCIKSFSEQTISDIEFIFVNDGSTDKSGEILDESAKENKSFKIIHKKNGGVSDARNEGLKHAKGEYIGFVDPDDWVEKDMFLKMYNKAKEGDYDIVSCDVNAVYPNYDKYIDSGISDDASINKLLVNAYAVIWNKIYKRELLKGITFKKGYIFEDVLFTFQVYPRVKKVGAIKEALYNYLQRDGSYTYTYNEKLYQAIEVNDEIIKFYKKNGYYNKYYAEIEYAYTRYLFATFIKRIAKTKNFKELKRGAKYVKSKVNATFPKYKKNKYLKNRTFKNIYIKHFSIPAAYFVYFIEKNRMN